MGVKVEKDRIAEAFADKELITQALAKGVRDALLQHKRAGNPVVEWRDGKIVWIQPEDIIVDEEQS